jgi:bacterioferritin-associated ferredoxin
MYVCVCSAVTDDEIRAEIRSGACTMRDLRQRLGIAMQCGRCIQCAQAILTEFNISSVAPASEVVSGSIVSV